MYILSKASLSDLLRTVDEHNDKGVTFISQKENIDTDTPQVRFMLAFFAALSELEREQRYLILKYHCNGVIN